MSCKSSNIRDKYNALLKNRMYSKSMQGKLKMFISEYVLTNNNV